MSQATEPSTIQSRIDPARLQRPLGVVAVAFVQLLKAAVLLLTVAMLRFQPDWSADVQSPFYPLLYIATRGNIVALSHAMQQGLFVPGILTLLALYLGVLGLRLWNLNPRARRTIMFTSGISLLLYAKSKIAPDAPDTFVPHDLQNFHILLALDLLVFVYLSRNATVSFFPRRKRP
jgi:hypothetical protein